MTVYELIDELKDLPEHYTVSTCNGMGLSGDAYIEHRDDETETVWLSA